MTVWGGTHTHTRTRIRSPGCHVPSAITDAAERQVPPGPPGTHRLPAQPWPRARDLPSRCGEVTEPTRCDTGLAFVCVPPRLAPRHGQRLASARRGGLLGCHNPSASGAASAGAVSGVKLGVTWIEHPREGGLVEDKPPHTPPKSPRAVAPPVPGCHQVGMQGVGCRGWDAGGDAP